ncbi:hypothetical protein GYA19_04275 [Candidatus Beckwithbacteria bacterium]|nr:hypothetical protein [Candidatus Beckwithbacteria bacterium]
MIRNNFFYFFFFILLIFVIFILDIKSYYSRLILGDKQKVQYLEVSVKTPEYNFYQKLGQMFMIVPNGAELSLEEIKLLRKGEIGGFFLLEKNIKNEEQVKQLVEDIHRQATYSGIVPFVAVDQEGGQVCRIPWLDCAAQAAVKNEQQAFALVSQRAKDLKKLGFNMVFAPVIEKGINPDSFIVKQQRAFSDNEINLALSMITAYNNVDLYPVVKHLPTGLAKISTDPHLTLPKIDDNKLIFLEDLSDAEEILARAKILMVTHLLYPQIDRNPTSASSVFLQDYLRQRLNYQGLIMIDDLSMGAIRENYDLAEFSKQSILAGADLLLVSDQNDFTKINDYFLQATISAKLQERVTESFDKIMEAKKRFRN